MSRKMTVKRCERGHDHCYADGVGIFVLNNKADGIVKINAAIRSRTISDDEANTLREQLDAFDFNKAPAAQPSGLDDLIGGLLNAVINEQAKEQEKLRGRQLLRARLGLAPTFTMWSGAIYPIGSINDHLEHNAFFCNKSSAIKALDKMKEADAITGARHMMLLRLVLDSKLHEDGVEHTDLPPESFTVLHAVFGNEVIGMLSNKDGVTIYVNSKPVALFRLLEAILDDSEVVSRNKYAGLKSKIESSDLPELAERWTEIIELEDGFKAEVVREGRKITHHRVWKEAPAQTAAAQNPKHEQGVREPEQEPAREVADEDVPPPAVP